jgi:hypothetical protein
MLGSDRNLGFHIRLYMFKFRCVESFQKKLFICSSYGSTLIVVATIFRLTSEKIKLIWMCKMVSKKKSYFNVYSILMPSWSSDWLQNQKFGRILCEIGLVEMCKMISGLV